MLCYIFFESWGRYGSSPLRAHGRRQNEWLAAFETSLIKSAELATPAVL